MTFDEYAETHNLHPGSGRYEACKEAWYAAINEVLKEWRKPWGMSEGKAFIERLENMANV